MLKLRQKQTADSRAASGRYEVLQRTGGWEGKRQRKVDKTEEPESRKRPARCKHSMLSVSIS